MTMQYNDETDSVRYLTTSETDSTSTIKSYNIPGSLSRRASTIWRSIRSMSSDRILLLFAVTLSLMALILSAAAYFDRKIEHDFQNIKAMKSTQDRMAVTHDGKAFTTPAYIEIEITGSGMEKHEKHDTTEKEEYTNILTLINSEFDKRENMLLKNISNLFDQYVENTTNTSFYTYDDLGMMNQSVVLVKSQMNELNILAEEMQSKSENASQLLFDAVVSSEKLLNNLTQAFWSTSSQMESRISSIERKLAYTQAMSDRRITSVRNNVHTLLNLMSNIISSTGEKLKNIHSNMTSQKKFAQSKIEALSQQIEKISADKATFNSRISGLIKTLQANMTNLAFTSRAKIQQMNSKVQQITNPNPTLRNMGTRITQVSNSLNAAIQIVRRRVELAESRTSSIQKTMDNVKSSDEMLQSLNSSFLKLKEDLQGKADRGWIQASNGFEYQVTLNQFPSWHDAKDACESLDAKLAHAGIRSNSMHNFIFTNLIEPCGKSAWIGLTDILSEGVWKWIDGQVLRPGDSYWAPYQPNNVLRSSLDQDCAEIDAKDGQWNDLWCMRSGVRTNVALCERRV